MKTHSSPQYLEQFWLSTFQVLILYRIRELFGQQTCFQNMETVPCRCSNFTKFTTKHLPKALFEESCLITPCSFSNKGSLSQVFSCEFCEFFQNIVLQATYGFVVETSLCLVPTEAKPFLKNMISLFLNQAVFDLLVMKLIWSLFIEGIDLQALFIEVSTFPTIHKSL